MHPSIISSFDTESHSKWDPSNSTTHSQLRELEVISAVVKLPYLPQINPVDLAVVFGVEKWTKVLVIGCVNLRGIFAT